MTWLKTQVQVSKIKMSTLSIIGTLEKLDKLNKSNPFRYMTNGNKNKQN